MFWSKPKSVSGIVNVSLGFGRAALGDPADPLGRQITVEIVFSDDIHKNFKAFYDEVLKKPGFALRQEMQISVARTNAVMLASASLGFLCQLPIWQSDMCANLMQPSVN